MNETKRERYIRILSGLGGASISAEACKELVELLKEQPERPKGEWIPVDEDDIPYGLLVECSKCGHRIIINDALEHNYCSECGADMRNND